MRVFFSRLKGKLGRYYKIGVPFIKVWLGTSLERKNTTFVINATKKEPRKFFDAKIYDLVRLEQRIKTASPEELQKDDIRELLETLPLLLLNIAWTKERWFIGKIHNQPFDIFIAPERFVRKNGKTVDIYRGLHIQTKRLYRHPPKELSPEEWVDYIQRLIEEKITPTDFGFNGHIHFYNLIPLNGKIRIGELKKLLKRMHVPFNKHVDSMSLSMEIPNDKKETTIVTWFIYPTVNPFVGVLEADYQQARKIYVEHDIFKMMVSALQAKEAGGSNFVH